MTKIKFKQSMTNAYSCFVSNIFNQDNHCFVILNIDRGVWIAEIFKNNGESSELVKTLGEFTNKKKAIEACEKEARGLI